MNRVDIIRMAREAGIHVYPEFEASFERFASLVAAAEREACALVCTNIANKPSNVILGVAVSCADAIRNRGKQ